MKPTWGKVVGALTLGAIGGYFISQANNTDEIDYTPKLESYSKDKPKVDTSRTEKRSSRAIISDLEEQVSSLNTKLKDTDAKYKPIDSLLPLTEVLPRIRGTQIPLDAALELAKAGKGSSYFDKDNGIMYLDTEPKATIYVPNNSRVGRATKSGQMANSDWGLWAGRNEKFKNGLEFSDGGHDYRAMAFGSRFAASVITVFDKKTGEVVGTTANLGSIYDFDIKKATNSRNEDVLVLAVLGLDNAVQSVSPDVQRTIMGPKFSNFITEQELAQRGICGHKENGNITGPNGNQYALTITFTQAFGDGITGGLVNTLNSINAEGNLRKDGEPSYFDTKYASQVSIPTNTGLFFPRQVKPSITEYLAPIETGTAIESLSIDGNQANFSIKITGDQLTDPKIYAEFATASGYPSAWNITTNGSLNIADVLDKPQNPSFDKKIKEMDEAGTKK